MKTKDGMARPQTSERRDHAIFYFFSESDSEAKSDACIIIGCYRREL
jgi:hypothetical protein